MRETLVGQYNHAWKTFHKMVMDFDGESWTKTGCSYIVPARIAYHVIGGVSYYIENETKVTLLSGKENSWNWETAPADELPTQEGILELIHVFKVKTDTWIATIDLETENKKFEWTGANRLSVVLFLLRHMEYHIGELNLLLHLSKNGAANDNWVKALDDFQV